MGSSMTRVLLARIGSLRKSAYAKGVAVLAGGTAFGQLLSILAAPLLTRLYTPSDFGVLASFSAVTGILAIVASWRYEMAIVIPEDDTDGVNVLALSTLLSLVSSAFCLILIVVVGEPVNRWIGASESSEWLWYVSLSVLATGIYQSLNFWSSRKRQFGRLSAARIALSASSTGAQSGLGILHAGAPGLLGGQVIGQVLAGIVLAWHVLRKDLPTIRSNVSWKRIRIQAARFRKFPLFTVPNGLLNMASQQLPSFVIPLFFGSQVLGQFYLAQRMFYVPISFLGQAFDQVFYQKATEHQRDMVKLRRLVLNSYRDLMLIAVIPAVLLFAIGPWMFGWVFGPEWSVAGDYLRLLIPWLTLKFAVSPSTAIFAILDKQDVSFIYEVCLFIARLGAIILGSAVLRNVSITIGLYASVGLASNVYLAAKILTILKESEVEELA